MDITTGFHI